MVGPMVSRLSVAFVAAFACGVVLGACGSPHSKCALVLCQTGTCDENTGLCVRVATDGGTDAGTDAGQSGCPGGCASPRVCDPTSKTCVECLSDSSCACPTPTCSAAHVCVAPSGDAGITAPASSDTCSAASPLRTCGTSAHFTVDLSTAKDDFTTGCSATGSGGKDVFWTVVLDATFDVRVTVKPASGSQAQPIVALLGSCEATSELACADGLGNTATVHLKSLPAGRYPLVVDSYDLSTGGLVDVTVELLPPTLPSNETCGTATSLPVDGGAVSVDLSTAEDNLQVSCNAKTDSPEVVYTVDVVTPSDLIVVASGTADAGIDPVLSLRNSPCGSGTTLRCIDGFSSANETLHARALAAGRYYLVVENARRPTRGSLALTAALAPPAPNPPNDTCNAPRAITFAAGSDVSSFVVDTSNASDDTAGSCNSQPASPEVVYSLTLGATRTVKIETAPVPGTTTDPVLYLRAAPCTSTLTPDGGPDNELGCDDAQAPAADSLTKTLQAGTYFIFVEGWSAAGAGPTQVTVSLLP